MEQAAFRRAIKGPEARRILFDGDRPRFVLGIDDFEPDDLEELWRRAIAIRAAVRDDPLACRDRLPGRRVMHLFAQPSTRTCESFVAATELLGGSARVVSDLSATSLVKGESVADAIQVFAHVFDAVVVRHPDPDFAWQAAHGLYRGPASMVLVSAGTGAFEHPTQAMLDGLALRESLGGNLANRRVLVVSDLHRNRTARSFGTLMARFPGTRIDLVSPEAHRPDSALLDSWRARGAEVVLHDDLEATLRSDGRELDVIYMTRSQQEWDDRDDYEAPLGADPRFVLRPEFGELLRDDVRLMHPLPRVNELPEIWDAHPHNLIWAQVDSGRWVRAALLEWMLTADG
ncbi:MAG: hypothetical protein AAF211_11415 [Myxococcota bacterium]